MAEAPWRANANLLTCNYLDCSKKFTATNRGQVCNGCKAASYCGSQCQKNDWSRHASNCKHRQKMLRDQNADTSFSEPYPRITYDLSNWVGTTSHVLCAAARSGLRLGRPDSLAHTHFLFLQLEYLAPPRSRRILTASKPMGDERELFRFVSITVLPDEIMDKWKLGGSFNSKQKRIDREREQKAVGPGNEVFSLFNVAMTADGIGDGATSQTFTASYTSDFHPLSFSERQLNPNWEMMIPLGSQRPVPKSQEEAFQEQRYLDTTDLALSETLETLQKISPPSGEAKEEWSTLQEGVKKFVSEFKVKEVPMSRAMRFMMSM